MGSPSSELPEFFKVYLPDYSRKRLKIPTAFIKHFNGLVPEKSIIRDSIGRVWHVEVGQVQNEVYFLKGWQRFLTDNSVEEGDFFVFRYDGYHTFHVMLFGKNACQKRDLDKKDFCVKEEQDVEEAEREKEEEGNKEGEEKEEEEEDEEYEEEEEDEEDEDEEDEEEEDSTEEEEESLDEEEPQPVSSEKKVSELKHKYSGRGRPRGGKRNCLFLLEKEDFCVKEEQDVEAEEREKENKEEKEKEKAKDEEEEEEEEEEEDEEDEEEGKEEEEEEEEQEQEEEEEEDDSTEEEDESPDEEDDIMNNKEDAEPQPQSSKKKMIELKHKYPGRGRPRTGGYKRNDVKNTGVEYIGTSHSKSKSKNPSCNMAEVEDSFAMESIFETRNPYFTTRLRKGRRSRLYIPADVLKDYNTSLPKKVFFRDPLERTWPGNVSLWKDGRTWITGWKAFCKWNHVRENDTLICELVQEGGRQTDLIVVHIHRAQPSVKGWIANQSCKQKGERK